MISETEPYKHFDNCVQEALEQMKKSLWEGGLPIGSVLARGSTILSRGHNLRVQTGMPTAHGEMTCLNNAGRLRTYKGLSLYTTLAPCMMCSGTIVQFKIPHVVILDRENFSGNIEFLESYGVQVDVLDHAEAISLMQRFIAENEDLWLEDIAED